jgi:hypothetical protein
VSLHPLIAVMRAKGLRPWCASLASKTPGSTVLYTLTKAWTLLLLATGAGDTSSVSLLSSSSSSSSSTGSRLAALRGPGLPFPDGTTVNGTFSSGAFQSGVNLFDAAAGANPNLYIVPSWVGNSASPDDVEISDSTAPEFATVLGPNGGCPVAANVSITRAGWWPTPWSLGRVA